MPTVVTPPQSHLWIHMARNPHQVLHIGLMVKISTRLLGVLHQYKQTDFDHTPIETTAKVCSLE